MRTAVIDALATHRIVRLLQVDEFPPVRRAREAFHASDAVSADLKYMATCPWCLGFWVGLAVTLVRREAPRAWDPLAHALAYSTVAGAVELAIARVEP